MAKTTDDGSSTKSSHFPIDAEARGKVRFWKIAASRRFERIDRFLKSGVPQQLGVEMVAKTGVGRRRAFDKLHQTFTAQGAVLDRLRLDGKHPAAIWAVLRPRGATHINTTDPRDLQDCVMVQYILAGALPNKNDDDPRLLAGIADGGWTLEVTDHALGRLMQRNRRAEIGTVLIGAHHAILNTRTSTASPFIYHGHRLLIPAGNGVFGVEMIMYTDISLPRYQNKSFHLMARHWLDHDQLRDDQDDMIEADIGNEGERLGDSWLTPAPHRRIIPISAAVDEKYYAPITWHPEGWSSLVRPEGSA